mgnify:CR=1 FL=1
MDAGLVAYNNPNDYNARANLMIASSYSHNGLTNIGKNSMMPIHQLEHEVSARNPSIAHGAGLAILTPAWMEIISKYDKPKFIKYAKNVMMIKDDLSDDELINKSIQMMKDFYKSIGMPERLSSVGIKEEDIIVMADRLSKNGTFSFGSYVPLTRDLMIEIYKKCY